MVTRSEQEAKAQVQADIERLRRDRGAGEHDIKESPIVSSLHQAMEM